MVLSLFCVTTFADVKYSNFDENLAQANSTAKTVNARKVANQVADFDRELLLRCWQEGQLISSDRGWKPLNKSASTATFKSGDQEMLLYQFGETFCIYTGE